MGEQDKKNARDERDPKVETDEVEAHAEQDGEDTPWCIANGTA